ncbi:unnamed protein product [Tetraodon nigroviridis]|uniref:(spotted green pufferfish) hypothetical protein n=1 Tax=Tetraodon nigroviridis TaxID=99883 RepID=Q4RSG9_TETNG|nr:unnamed protein product [Tetraodon nigroviridis]
MALDWPGQTPSISAHRSALPLYCPLHSSAAIDGQVWAQITPAARVFWPGPINHLKMRPVIISKPPREQTGAESTSSVDTPRGDPTEKRSSHSKHKHKKPNYARKPDISSP